MNLKISNTLSKKKELFKPINSKNITMYACGPTVYDDPHVGNARSLVVFDLLFRTLKKIYGDKNVTYVRNITDIDDKIIDTAKEKNLPIKKITEEVTNQFHNACKDLNCLEPTVEPKATGHVDGMIKMTSSLIEKGFAYINEGHVYFSIASFKNYGKLSGKKLEDLEAGARVEVDERIEADDNRILTILDKMLKQRRDSINQYISADREDLANIEKIEVEVINKFLPEPLNESEIKELKDMGFDVINKFDATNDILAVFELISICDQILTNQGAVAHFAGAVGQNTLMFRPKNARWVWTQEIEKSYFYPSIRFVERY